MKGDGAPEGQHALVPTLPLENVFPVTLLWGQMLRYHLGSLGYFCF